MRISYQEYGPYPVEKVADIVMGKNVLIAENEPAAANEMARVLSSEGYGVSIAAGGEKAVDLTAASSPDIVLMDIGFGSGIDCAETARKILAIREIPIIFLVSPPESDTVSMFEEISPYGCLLKPVVPAELCASLRMALRLHDAGRRRAAGKKENERTELLAGAEEIEERAAVPSSRRELVRRHLYSDRRQVRLLQ